MESPDAVGKASLAGRAPYVTIYIRSIDGVVERAMFTTYGCGVSIACCSALTEMIAGSTLADCRSLNGSSLIDALDGIPEEKRFCAHLAVEALQDAIAKLSDATRPNIEQENKP